MRNLGNGIPNEPRVVAMPHTHVVPAETSRLIKCCLKESPSCGSRWGSRLGVGRAISATRYQ